MSLESRAENGTDQFKASLCGTTEVWRAEKEKPAVKRSLASGHAD